MNISHRSGAQGRSEATHLASDAVLYPAHYGSLPFGVESEFRFRDLLREGNDSCPAILPVPSAGIHPGIVGRALRDYGNDVALNAGSAIFDHPDGPETGTYAFFDVLEVAQGNGKLVATEVESEPLKKALEKWGGE